MTHPITRINITARIDSDRIDYMDDEGEIHYQYLDNDLLDDHDDPIWDDRFEHASIYAS